MHNQWINKGLFFLVVLLAFGDGILVAKHWEGAQETAVSSGMVLEDVFEQKNSPIDLIVTDKNEEDILMAPPFLVQTPYGIWEDPWTHTAEEACLYMALQWVNGMTVLDKKQAADSLLQAVEWEKNYLGLYADTDLFQVRQLAQNFYGLRGEILENPSQDDLIVNLNLGQLIIVPVNGQILDNPRYSDPAPTHHMILLYANAEGGFLAHDPGTLRGAETFYANEKILESIHDLEGGKRVLLIER